MTARAFQVKIVGDVADAKKSLQSLEKRTGKFASAMKGVGGAMVAAFAVKKVFDFGKAAVARAEEMSTVWGIAGQIIEETGGAANVSLDGLKAMNQEMSRRTGIDKAMIASGSNVLLTFKGIKNEIGEGNDVFDRANGLMLDMSTVFGGDAKSAATQLGKALEDPIKGIGALSRVGVTFTDDQKEMIKQLVESGNTLDAQKMILAALEGQVGGTAEASANATDKLKNAWLDIQEKIGTLILPALEALSAWVVDTALPAFESFWLFISDLWNRVTALFQGGSNEQLETAKGWLSEIIGYYQDFAKMVMAIINRFVTIATWVWKNFGEEIMAVMKVAWDQVSAIIDLIIGVVRNAVKLITAIMNGDWAAAWDAAKGIVMAFWDFFKGLPGRMVDALRASVGLVGSAAMALGKAIINGIIGFWNKLDPRISFGVPSWVPVVGGKSWESPDLFPDIPTLAKGGIATGPTLAMIGEGRHDEAVIPLPKGMSGLGNTYQINVETIGGDPVAIGQGIVDAITTYERSAGDDWRTAAASGF